MTSRSPKKVRVLILITWAESKHWPFVEALRSRGLECDLFGANFPDGYNSVFNKIIHFWTRYLLIGIKAYLRRRDYDVVLGWQQVAGMVFGFLKRIFCCHYPKLVIMKFTYPQRKNPLIAKIRYGFVRYVLGATDELWCLSNEEVRIRSRLFHLEDRKVRFVPLSVTNISDGSLESFEVKSSSEDYILSIGNERDFKLLFDVVKEIDATFKIVTQPYNIKNLIIPQNVSVYHIFGHEVIKMYRNARFVVIPMKDPKRPGGESAIIESMSYGKAIIITKTVTSVDYIKPMENGLLVKPRDHVDLFNSIQFLLKNTKLAKEMGERNRVTYIKQYSNQAISDNVRHLILQMVRS